MLSNMNQQAMESPILYFNSHTTKNESKEFSIYRPDVDFSLNYEPINKNQAEQASTRLVNDAKEITTAVPAADSSSGASEVKLNGDDGSVVVVVNGFRAVRNSFSDHHYASIVHNYSKVPDSMTMVDMQTSDRNNNNNNSNSSHSRESTATTTTSEDGEEGNRDDNNNASNKLDDKKPEHHVRRPMNAFLIFCKRHRALVREKYPNLENRSITKILGDWWAFLPIEDKSPYKELAKNYKDVFFSKNPNFKWYKLPAPPLRTLSTRPSNDRERAMTASPVSFNGEEVPDSPTTKDRAARNIKQNPSGFGQFKLASLDQMGGLSSLMVASSSPVRVNGGGNVVVLDSAKDDFESPPKKRKNEEVLEFFDEEIAGKSRACKGKRYEQFMTPTKKATKQKSSTASSTSVQQQQQHQFPHNGYCKPQQHEAMAVIKNDDLIFDEIAHSPESEEIDGRNADANDFKLNDKIMTLPSLDLDDYLNRKKAMKKKKKFTHKAKHRQPQSQAVPKDKAIPKPIAIVVGSQKRKAPKQTIRRTGEQPPTTDARVGLIGLDTLATVALVQANASPQ